MNLDMFTSFLETARLKSIAKASHQLNLSHPALSKQIRKMEDFYGTALFIRSAAGVELTEAGKLLYERIPPILSELKAIQEDIHALTGSKKIKLGTLPSLSAHYVPKAIFDLESKGVQIGLTVQYTSEQLVDMLRVHTIDAAIVDAQFESGFFWSRELFTEPFYVILPSSHPLSTCSALTLEHIKNEPLIMYPPACSIRKCVTSLYAELGMSPCMKTEIPFGDFILGYVAAGAGISIVPEMIAAPISNPLLKAIPIAHPQACRTITLLALSETTGKRLLRDLKKQFIY
ncbi:LysR family transcriptional regulator [Paenibacillus sp. SI8]|uniref:LysR family transcriptional regulator n=1 Tax=unclassified Paenibacillus TaxID=185978 RepID=UPI0034657A89